MTFSRDMEIFNKWKFGLNSFQMDVKKWFSVRSHMHEKILISLKNVKNP